MDWKKLCKMNKSNKLANKSREIKRSTNLAMSKMDKILQGIRNGRTQTSRSNLTPCLPKNFINHAYNRLTMEYKDYPFKIVDCETDKEIYPSNPPGAASYKIQIDVPHN
jgi:hypothetical protein